MEVREGRGKDHGPWVTSGSLLRRVNSAVLLNLPFTDGEFSLLGVLARAEGDTICKQNTLVFSGAQ